MQKWFKCDVCQGVFQNEDDWTEEMVKAEYHELSKHLPQELYDDYGVVCDDCYVKVVDWINSPAAIEYERSHGIYR